MKVWLTRDNNSAKDIYVWPEDEQPDWDFHGKEWMVKQGLKPGTLGKLGTLPITLIHPLPVCLRRGGRKAIVLRDLQFLESA